MRKTPLLALAFALPLGTAQAAAPATVQVVGVDGRPLAGAVVTLSMPGVAAPQPRGTYTVAQRNISFDPHVLVVPVGATVAFPNFDKVRHHVYSFSAAKRFDLKLFGREDNRSVTFDRPGAVALGCNIHDAMNAVVYVTDSPYTAVTDANGRVRLSVAGAGAATVAVWHPSIRAKANTLTQAVTVTAAGLETTLRLRR